MNYKHGMAKTKIYRIWLSMHQRCYDSKREGYKNYGARGIIVCPRWHDLGKFITDVGQPPPNTTLDRINNDGNYEPGNIRWTTHKIQNRNSRQAKLDLLLVNKIQKMYTTGKYTQRELAYIFGVAKGTIYYVVNNITWR